MIEGPEQYQAPRETPSTLGSAGRAVWERYMVDLDGVPVYRYGIDETLLLEQMCVLYDRLEHVRGLIAASRQDGTDVMVSRTGELKLHPAFAHETQLIAKIAALSNAVRLPPLPTDEDVASQDAKTQQRSLQDHQRAAGKARWKVKYPAAGE